MYIKVSVHCSGVFRCVQGCSGVHVIQRVVSLVVLTCVAVPCGSSNVCICSAPLQAYHRAVRRLLAKLEEHWNCSAGATAFVTPAGAQGFAPRYDVTESFVLQLEGTMRWRVYDPLSEDHTTPVRVYLYS